MQSSRDATRKAFQRLKYQQRLLHKLSAQVPAVLYQLHGSPDGSMVFTYTSDATRSVFGLEPASDGHTCELNAVIQLVHPEDRRAFVDGLETSRRALTPLHEEFRIVRRDGRGVEWLETRAVPERTDDGGTVWHGYTAAVTERKVAELELKRDKDLWEMAADATGLGLLQFDRGADRLTLDQRASRIHGLKDLDYDLTLHDWLGSIHPDDRNDVESGMQRAAGVQESLLARYRLMAANDVPPVVELHAREFIHEPDPKAEVVGTCRDVTQQVDAERLRCDKEATERAKRAKTDLLSRVNHELRTPLNGILGFAQLMSLDRANPLAAAQLRRLDTLHETGRRLLALINDMLDLALIEREDFTMKCEPIDACVIALNCVSLIQPLAAECGVSLAEVREQACWVTGNARALEQVLTNLLSNAVKHNKRGGHVWLTLQQERDQVHIAVRDEGPGITQEQQARLFEPFETLGTGRGSIEGSGLGLAIARQLANAMEGELRLRSAPGAGATFTVALRKAQCPSQPTAAFADTQPLGPLTGSGDTASHDHRHVLYIEDEPVNILIMEEVFRMRPHWTLSIATNGAEGLRRAAQEQPDLLLIDMNLPDMTGMELLACLRASTATRNLVSVALSADVLCERIDAARRAGFDEYWTKPIDVPRMLCDLSRVLSCSTALRASPDA